MLMDRKQINSLLLSFTTVNIECKTELLDRENSVKVFIRDERSLNFFV